MDCDCCLQGMHMERLKSSSIEEGTDKTQKAKWKKRIARCFLLSRRRGKYRRRQQQHSVGGALLSPQSQPGLWKSSVVVGGGDVP